MVVIWTRGLLARVQLSKALVVVNLMCHIAEKTQAQEKNNRFGKKNQRKKRRENNSDGERVTEVVK